MGISHKFKHGDLVVRCTEPTAVGKVMTPDRMISVEARNYWRRNSPDIISLKETWVIVKWEKEIEVMEEQLLKPVPDAVRVLYGKI